MPSLSQFTVCLWMKSSDTRNEGTPFSYNTPGMDNTIDLLSYKSFELWINNERRYCLSVTYKPQRAKYFDKTSCPKRIDVAINSIVKVLHRDV